MSRQETQQKYLYRLFPLIRRGGWSDLTIEDILKAMSISRATFYKYFTSKEDLLTRLIEEYLVYLEEAVAELRGSEDYIVRFQQIFLQSLAVVGLASEDFLQDVRQTYPQIWERIRLAERRRNDYLSDFYRQGMGAGWFNQVNAQLLVLQEESFLRTIIAPRFLMEQDASLRQILLDYYELLKYEALRPENRPQVNDAAVIEGIEEFIQKLSLQM